MTHRSRLWEEAYSANSTRAETAALSAYRKFIHRYPQFAAQSLSVNSLSIFISYMSITGYAPNTIITYTSLICNSMHSQLSKLADHFLIKRILKSVRKSTKPDIRLPVTESVLRDIISAASHVCSSAYEALIYATLFSLAFYSLCRVSELTATAARQGTYSASLKDGHVYVSERNSLQRYVQLTIAKSKSDQYGKSATLRIHSQPDKASCPWRLTRRFKRMRPLNCAQFFVHRDGTPVTDRQFNSVLKLCLEFASVPNSDQYSSHSFRIGGCSALADKGESEQVLKQAGRWRSSAYKRYIRSTFTIPW